MRPADARRLLAALALTVFAAPAFAASSRPAAALDGDLLSGLALRSIGPAAMSGRVAAVAGTAADPAVLYIGAAAGGVWKSIDSGTTWRPVFDEQPVASIGAVSVFAGDADVVWAGTGEGNPRNSVSYGRGIWRSLDGGETWQHLGLAASERIHRIVLHPTDRDTVWVAALGPLWSEGGERGVYKTTDGGRTWRRVLQADERTGAGELVADPRDPQTLYAALWQVRRWPWYFRSGGPGSGLFVSHDGGESWTERTAADGLPEGDLGRIGIAVAASDPQVVYALVESAKDNVILRSGDGGRTFRTVNREAADTERPFYFGDLRVDPTDPRRVYNLGMLLKVSDDGGATFRELAGWGDAHPDHHALWIAPADPRFLVDGNDGGVAISTDRGESWRFVANLPLAQFYHLRVDDALPFNVYGGLQDNGSWRGPSTVWQNGPIRNHHWQEVGFGDGFDTAPDPANPRQGYAMSQGGYLFRWDLDSGERRMIKPAAPEPADPAGEPSKLRFNWNAGFAIDPFDPATIYLGSQFVHRSRDRGQTWELASPDLTTNDPARQRQETSGGLTLDVTNAENFTTIVAIAPSPIARGTVWVGTDDGRLQVTRDDGASWTSVEGKVRGVPRGSWIPHVEPSRHDAETAFVVFDNHRRGDFATYAAVTRDGGRSFTTLAAAGVEGHALAIAQDPVDPQLLFLGTELGLWVSLDGGAAWTRWNHGLPKAVPVADLLVHPRDGDLVVATHGRSLWVLDDVRPLRELTPELLAAPLHLFAPAPAQQAWHGRPAGARFGGATEAAGENRPYGALLTFVVNGDDLPWATRERERARLAEKRTTERRERAAELLKEDASIGAETPSSPPPAEASAAPTGDDDREKAKDEKQKPRATIEVRDAAGAVIRRFEVAVDRGVNRATWDLTRRAFRTPADEEDDEETPGGDEDTEGAGPEVPPGRYTVTIRFGGEERSAPVEVVADPRIAIAPAARAAKWDTVLRAGAARERLTDGIDRIVELRADLDSAKAKLETRKALLERGAPAPAGPDASPAKAEVDLLERLGEVEEKLVAQEKRLRVPPKTKGISEEDDASSRLGEVEGFLESSWDVATADQLRLLARSERQVADEITALDALVAAEVVPLRDALATAGIGFLVTPTSAP